MLKAVLKAIVGVVGAGALLGGVLYAFFGLRAELDGSGWPHLVFKMSPEEQAALIERHRASQRAHASAGTASAAVSTSEPATSVVAAAPSAATTDESSGPVTAAPMDVPPPAAAATATADVPPAMTAPPVSWPDFRGPRRDGVYRGGPIRTTWPSEGLTPLWKQPIGGGYASFVVASSRAFTIEQRAHQEVVAAYDVASGRELWTNAWDGMFQETMGGDGPRATPTWAGGVVYALGALGELRALDDATGRVRWRTNILQDAAATNLQWGMSAAPLVVDDVVVVLPGGRGGQSVLAYNRTSGQKVWGALPDQAAYASPMLVTLGGVRQILVLTADRLVGLSVDGGAVLWSHPWVGPNNGINAAQPVPIGDDRFYLSSGYGLGATVVEVSGGASGFTTREVWRNTRMKNRFASAVLREGVIYGLDESILAAIDASTGEQKWKGGRYGYGQLLLAGGHLIVLTEDGDLALVRATPDKHEELARFPVLNGKTWNPPALANGVLLVRNLAEMAAFDLRVTP
jgi:outer membrane protein assembly factor BamB